MRIEILDKAEDDLVAGFHFYEEQENGLGEYFLESLYSDRVAEAVCRDPSADLPRLPSLALEAIPVRDLL